MPATEVPDENGEVMRLMDIDGYFLPELPAENQEEEFRTVKDWKARENDVIICAYPKSVDFGSWFDYVKNWENVIKQEKDYPVHLINYEDLKENGFEEVKKLAKFLGVEEDIQLFKSIYEVCQFDNLKKKKDEIEELDYWKNSTPGMYRKGIAGDWKNWFTVKQNEDFNQIYEDKMKDSKLKFKYLY